MAGLLLQLLGNPHEEATMHVILGATGHIGSALVSALLARGEPTMVVTHDEEKRAGFEQRGVKVAVLDVHDVDALRGVFRSARRAFLLNPPAPPDRENAPEEERKSAAAIVAAVRDSGLEAVVAASTYGAQPGEGIGDLSILYELEQGLHARPIPATIVRSAYYMSNWDFALESARAQGRIQSLYPADFKLPMVAPRDIAHLVAELLTSPLQGTSLHFIEGPAHYTAADVAAAFAALLDKPVAVDSIPEAQWNDALIGMGFAPNSAASMAAMTRATLHEPHEPAHTPRHGPTTLFEYLQELHARAH
jgi:uncharacterized protein YbjT (DUF2867 family)